MLLILHSQEATHQWAMRLQQGSPQVAIQVNSKPLQKHMDSLHHNPQDHQDIPAPILKPRHLAQAPLSTRVQHSSRTQAAQASRPSSVLKISSTLSWGLPMLILRTKSKHWLFLPAKKSTANITSRIFWFHNKQESKTCASCKTKWASSRCSCSTSWWLLGGYTRTLSSISSWAVLTCITSWGTSLSYLRLWPSCTVLLLECHHLKLWELRISCAMRFCTAKRKGSTSTEIHKEPSAGKSAGISDTCRQTKVEWRSLIWEDEEVENPKKIFIFWK